MEKTALKMIHLAPTLILKATLVIGTNGMKLIVTHIMEVPAQEALLLLQVFAAAHVEVELELMSITHQTIHGSLVSLGHQTQQGPVMAKLL